MVLPRALLSRKPRAPTGFDEHHYGNFHTLDVQSDETQQVKFPSASLVAENTQIRDVLPQTERSPTVAEYKQPLSEEFYGSHLVHKEEENPFESHENDGLSTVPGPYNKWKREVHQIHQPLRGSPDGELKGLSRFGIGRSKSVKESEDWEKRASVSEKNLKACQAKLDASKKAVSKLSVQRDALEEANERLERVNERLRQEGREKVEVLKANTVKEVEKWRGKTDKAKADVEQIERQHSLITRQYQDSHRHEVVQLRADHKDALRRAAEAARAEAAAAERKHRDASQERENAFASERVDWNTKLRMEKQNSDNRLLELQRRHDVELSALHKHIDEKTKSFKNEQSELTSELARFKSELAQSQSVDKNDLRKAVEAAKVECEASEKRHRKTLEQLENAFARERAEWHARIQAEKEDHKERLLEQKQRHDNDVMILHKKLDARIESFEDERLQMRSEFAAQARDLQKKNESLTGALLKRDHFKGLADFALCAKFSSLSVKLEMISFKAAWNTNRVQTWPFPENSLNRLCPKGTSRPNVRKIKQQIIQNSLWFILYYFVFSTPFRVLGKNGKDLDENWFGEFGGTLLADETSKWPPATPESEKKRYEVAKSCLEAIQNSRRGPDEKGHRQQYTVAVQRILEHIRELVERVTHVDSRDEQKFKELIDDSAKLWLEACSQRYRFRVTFPPGAEDVVLRPNNNLRTMRLIVKPSLVRYGNTEGQDLTRAEFLSDWSGRTIEYEYLEPTGEAVKHP